jgi:hypothetical protein
MFTITARPTQLCDRISRREMLRIGSLGVAGLTLPELLRQQASAAPRRAKACIVLFLFGGPAQHSTWDPKPLAPAEVRGELKPIATTVPGLQVSELLPQTAKLARHLCLLRAVRTGDNAHSSSGYYMLTGQPHSPMNQENANPGAPNNWPSFASVVRRLNAARRRSLRPCDCRIRFSTPTARSGPVRMLASWGARTTRGSFVASRPPRISKSLNSRYPPRWPSIGWLFASRCCPR